MGDATWTQRYKAIQYDAVRTVPEKVRNLQTNRIATIGNQTPTYNAAGEMTSDGTGTGSTQYTWNAEGRIATVTPYGGATTSYVYDGDGHLVAEGTTPTLFWYDAGGKLLGVTGGSVNIEWIYFDGRRISKFVMAPAGPWGANFYDNADGSLLLETDGYGNTNCRANYDPFGDPVGSGCQAYESIQYAGLYTDGASGNDLATHRQLSDTYYRWLSPDPSGMSAVSLTDPQTWNMYAYALDNPTSLNDPSGLCSNASNYPCQVSNYTNNESSSVRNWKHRSAKAVGSAQKQSGGWFHKLLAGAAEWAAANGHPLLAGFLTRYMGAGEAEYARANGEIPNTYANGKFRPTHFTRDEPINDAKAAKERYTLPERPTHRATVPEERVPNPRIPDAGPTTEGGGSQVITDEPVPVSPDEIVPLDPGIPVDPIIIDPIP